MAFNLTQKEIIRNFWQMLDEMPYDEISVQDLCERVGVSRNTFYYHFPDLQALWERTAVDWFERMSEERGPFEGLGDCLLPLAHECGKHKKALKRLYRMVHHDVFRQGLDRVMRSVVSRYVESALQNDPELQADRESTELFYHSLLTGILLNWLEHDMDYDIEAFAVKVAKRLSGPQWQDLPVELATAGTARDPEKIS